MGLLKDDNFELKYHLNKANVVADTLSKKTLHVASLMIEEYILMESFVESQQDASLKIREEIEVDQAIEFGFNDDGFMVYRDRICVPDDVDLRKVILNKAHGSKYMIHPRATKMYQDVKQYWW
ncbi:uncharacterized protein LOC129316851 [Prosopis cineraria]|uniref:uncharacterized protein LOC129316851 n=1 Tax=Prosopis cineraria TaxID=364024 RepID=UPI00240ED5D9|nr:uncharacterized protein LOC129316851 [Prosopis cineraria]